MRHVGAVKARFLNYSTRAPACAHTSIWGLTLVAVFVPQPPPFLSSPTMQNLFCSRFWSPRLYLVVTRGVLILNGLFLIIGPLLPRKSQESLFANGCTVR